MRLKKYLRWELVLALSLVGCTSVLPNRLLGPATTNQPGGAPAGAPPVALSTQANRTASLYLQVKWPTLRQTQTLPQNTATIKVDIKQKDGTLVQHQDLTRPTAGSSTVTYQLSLDPALGKVDVFVQAVDGNGAPVAKGQVLDVPVRDNTATAIAVTLDTVDAAGNDIGLTTRLAPEVALVKGLPGLAQRYSNLSSYGNSAEMVDLKRALALIFGQLMNGNKGPTTSATSATTATHYRYATQSLASPSFVFTGGAPFTSVDLSGSTPTNFYWAAGYQMAYAFNGQGNNHTVDFNLGPTPSGSDPTTANLHAELNATNWIAEPNLIPSAYGYALGSSSLSSQSIVMFGGFRPDFPTIVSGKLHVDVTPNGNAAEKAGLDLALDQTRDVSNTAFFAFLQQKASASIPVTTWPGHGNLVVNTHTIGATADVKVGDDNLGAQASGSVRLFDKNGAPGLYNVGLGWQMRLGPVNGVTDIAGSDLSFVIDDVTTLLRLKGTAHLSMSPPALSIQAAFVDSVSNQVLGNVTYNLPIDANGKVDMSHLSSWPVLTVTDPTASGSAQTSTYNLTPGFFSGQTSGEVTVVVK